MVKPSAASPHLLKHRGRAVVFRDIEDFKKRVDDPALDVDENSVKFERPDGSEESVEYGALVLACSGFGSNAAMVAPELVRIGANRSRAPRRTRSSPIGRPSRSSRRW